MGEKVKSGRCVHVHEKTRKETEDIGKRNRKQVGNKEITDDNCAVLTK